MLLASTRTAAYLVDLAALLAMGYYIWRWPSTAGSAVGGLIGCVVAALNDSWETIAQLDPTLNFPPIKTARVVVHDLFSLAVCVGGLMLLLFMDLRERREAEDGAYMYERVGDWDTKRKVVMVAQWLVGAVAIMRLGFVLWNGCICSSERRQVVERRRRRQERRRTRRGPAVRDESEARLAEMGIRISR